MTIGITGATGQLGRIVVSKLKAKTSNTIVALVRSPEKATGLGVAVREADYDKPETLEKAFAGIETLLLISANDIGKRVVQHLHAIHAATKAGVQWIVYTSLLHADTSPLSLAEEHFATEKAIRESGIPFTILRNSWYTENYTNSIGGALAGGAFIGSAGSGKISSATREDFAEATAVVLSSTGHQGKTYELAGDTFYTLSDLAAEISRQTGKHIPYKNLPVADYAAALAKFGLPEGVAQAIAGWDFGASQGALFDDKHQLSALIGRQTTPLADAVAAALKQVSKTA
jgi:NAD(P)H dehydrogenase (quinone)